MVDATKRIRVLVVDDSVAFRSALALALAQDHEIEVVGQAGDGHEALALVSKLNPDVVTMDVVMPRMDGLEAAKQILASPRPIPILLMSTLARSEEQRMALNALRLGVVDVTNKPVLVGPGAAHGISTVTRLVKAAAMVDVPHRPRSGRMLMATAKVERQIELIVVAASTGGPPVLERILGALPRVFPPVVVAQHLAPSFAKGFAEWLAGSIQRTVVPVAFREPLRDSTIYVAGEHSHVRVGDGTVIPIKCGVTELSPNADQLFDSAAAFYGANALGIVLTGMGNDGAVGLAKMKRVGAWTIAQDAESSVVYGMPRAAMEAGAVCEQLSIDVIGARVIALLSGKDNVGIG